MSLADLSIRRPTFITCIVILMLAVGLLAIKGLGVDLFPDVTFPIVNVTTLYPGAGPEEVEQLISKPIEDEMSTINGVKRLSSINQEGVSTVIAEFTMSTDVKFAEQQIRDRVGAAKRRLPDDIEEPVIRRIDPADQPIVILSLTASSLSPADLYDLAKETIKPKLEQIGQVGLVEVLGGRRREIHVALDRDKLRAREISALQVAQRLKLSGENVPVGKKDLGQSETVFRTVGQFVKLQDIESTIVNFLGNDIPTTVADVGVVKDALEDERSRVYVNGKQSLFIYVFRQSGANTIEVTDQVLKQAEKINKEFVQINSTAGIKTDPAKLDVVRNGSNWIHANVDDVKESILFGICLTVFVVYFFLASFRSTIITGLALPNSLIGAFILMAIAGFTINVMSLLALSLAVGLLVDDAIVVRENIFRHLEMGKTPVQAASEGTAEVRLAVIATTLAVVAVFGPVGFLKGVVGQFFKEFGLTVCFAMAISLFDALTIAPMLSAYFAGKVGHAAKEGKTKNPLRMVAQAFDRFQTFLENGYEKWITHILQHPGKYLLGGFLTAFLLSASIVTVPNTFLPQQENGEFLVALDMVPGTSLDRMSQVALMVDQKIRSHPEVRITGTTVGGRNGESNVTEIYVNLVNFRERDIGTAALKQVLRDELKEFKYANPIVKDYDAVGGGLRPMTLNIVGNDLKELETYLEKIKPWIAKNPGLLDVDTNFRTGKPEFQVIPNKRKLELLGISSVSLGQELRAQIEGVTTAKFREKGLEYDIRVRLDESQRDLKDNFYRSSVTNINNRLVRVSDVAKPFDTTGPTKIYRQDRSRYVQVNADIAPGGGLGDVMSEIEKKFKDDPELKLPTGMRYAFIGQAENFQELGEGMMIAMGLGILFIFLVLSSLYESFITPFSIMLALPLAVCGSLAALAITRQSLNIFSMIGIVMLLGVASKNSILLVDFANQLVQQGMSRAEAIRIAGKTRLRPILMTTMALIAGTIPITLGLNEASLQRVSMGYAIMGGLISSTLLTLIVVPAAYTYVEAFKDWTLVQFRKLAAG